MEMDIEEPSNFLELSRWPKKMDCKTLLSLVVAGSNIVPKSCQISLKTNSFGDTDEVAILEYHSEADAIKTVDLLRSRSYSRNWDMSIIKNPLDKK